MYYPQTYRVILAVSDTSNH